MFTTMMASYFIIYSEQVAEHLEASRNIADLGQSRGDKPSKTKDFKQAIWSVMRQLSKDQGRYVLLLFHALLNFILIFDYKDFMVMVIFLIETITAPVHLYLYLKASPTHGRLRLMYYTYLPVFGACMFLVLFRYLLYFQK
jgi:hypothetical protein